MAGRQGLATSKGAEEETGECTLAPLQSSEVLFILGPSWTLWVDTPFATVYYVQAQDAVASPDTEAQITNG